MEKQELISLIEAMLFANGRPLNIKTICEITNEEKEIIGINIKYNFFHQFLSLYNKFRLFKIEDLKENMYIRTLGMVKYIRVIKTKTGESMAFISIEDDKDEIELTVFPRVYNALPNISVGQVVIVGGKVQKREQLQIVVDSIEKV